MAVTRFKEGADTSRSRRLDVLGRRHDLVRRRSARHARPHQPRHRRSERMAGARRRRGRPLRAHQGRPGSHLVLRSRNTKRLVGFDPKTEKFFANIEVSGTIRHMQFDKKTRMMWFGTDGEQGRPHRAAEDEVSTTLAAARPGDHVRLVASHGYRRGRAARILRRLQGGVVPRVPLSRGAEPGPGARRHRRRPGAVCRR